jgi:AcrR family transcriptional regulator
MIKTRSRTARKGSHVVPEVDGEKLKDRRKTIVAALRRCMVTKGYAETRLTDLARAAGISVSHFLYYFESKEAVLEEVCDEVVEQTLAEVTSYRDDPPEERIHVLVDHVFVSSVTPSELGVILELVGLSMHRSKIREKLDRYNREMMAYLTDLFEQVPRQPGVSSREAADIAAAILVGLLTNSQYDSGLDDGRARRLFRRSLFDLANIRNPESPAVPSNVLQRRSRTAKASA